MVMQRLKNLREDSDLTQTQLGEILNITQKTCSNYENGNRSIPVDILISAARFFNTSADYLLEMTDDKRPYANAKKYNEKLKKY